MKKIPEWTASAYPHDGQRSRMRGISASGAEFELENQMVGPRDNPGNGLTTNHETAVFSQPFGRSRFPNHRPAAGARVAREMTNQPGGSSGLLTCMTADCERKMHHNAKHFILDSDLPSRQQGNNCLEQYHCFT
jgi:hypothetical protein